MAQQTPVHIGAVHAEAGTVSDARREQALAKEVRRGMSIHTARAGSKPICVQVALSVLKEMSVPG